MRAVVQRVLEATVSVENQVVGQIGPGLLVYLGVSGEDTSDDLIWTAEKIIKMRIFPDQEERMNFPVTEIAGGILVVSQFTLFGDVKKGNRPSFAEAADPAFAKSMYDSFVKYIAEKGIPVQTGVFQAMMHVSSLNDGPVTMLLDSKQKVA